jgi:hypothetical protein
MCVQGEEASSMCLGGEEESRGKQGDRQKRKARHHRVQLLYSQKGTAQQQ